MTQTAVHPVPMRNGAIPRVPAVLLRGRLVFPVLCAVATLLALLPVGAAPVLPLLDVNSHVTRLHVLWSILVAGIGSRFYVLDTLMLPNMGFDLPGLVLSRWTDVATAGRIHFALMLLLTLGGVPVLGRVLSGRWSAVQLLAVLLTYSLYAVLGFLGYALGIALLFWALAARLLLNPRAAWQRLLAGGAIGAVLLLCHVAAFAIYAVMLAGIAIDGLWRHRITLRRVALTALEGLPAAALFLVMARGNEGGFQYFHPIWRSKLAGLAASLSAGNRVADIAAAAGLVLLAVLLGTVAATGGRVRMARPMLPGLAMLAVLFFALPPNVDTGSYVDERIPAVLLLLGIAALKVEVPRRRFPVLVLAALLGGACIVKQAALAVAWRNAAVPLAAVAAMVQRLPDGAVILQGECPPGAAAPGGAYAGREPPLSHAIAVAGHDGRRFVPVTWAIKGQQPIRVRPEYAPYKAVQDRFNRPVCTTEQAEAMLSAARTLLADHAAGGMLVAPVFLNLVRFPPSVPLSAPRVDGTPDMVLYAVAGP